MRIQSHARPVVTTPIGEVEAQVELCPIDGESVIVRAVFSTPGGATGVVERVSAEEWRAGLVEGWLPDTFESIHEAVEAACHI